MTTSTLMTWATMNVKYRQTGNRAEQHGLALVIVLWILTLLTLMAGSFAMSMRRDSSVSFAIKSNAEALAQAESGIIMAQFMLSQSDPELAWQADGRVYRVFNPDGEVRIRILAESGKVDINSSNETQLAALINSAVYDDWQQQELLNAILDWRDADDDTRTQGAERRQYRLAGLSYGPSNSAFQGVEELLLVLGMSEEIFNRLQPFITVYSGQPEVDMRYASPELLPILSNELRKRNIDDQALQKRMDGFEEEGAGLADIGSAPAAQNQTYTIIAEAMVHGEASAGLETVVKIQGAGAGKPFQTMDWKQKQQGPSLFDEAMAFPLITVRDEFRYDDRY